MQSENIQPVQKPKKGKSVLIKILKAISIPFILLIMGYLITVLFGDDKTIGSLNGFLDSSWWTLTMIRWVVFAVISFVIAPFIINRLIEKNKLKQTFLREEALKSEDDTYQKLLEYEVNRCEAQDIAYHKMLSNKRYILLLLVIFDCLTLQVPYLLKS